MENIAPILIGLTIYFAVLLAIFLICREIFCWYTKQNELVRLAERNNQLLTQILEKTQS